MLHLNWLQERLTQVGQVVVEEECWVEHSRDALEYPWETTDANSMVHSPNWAAANSANSEVVHTAESALASSVFVSLVTGILHLLLPSMMHTVLGLATMVVAWHSAGAACAETLLVHVLESEAFVHLG